MSDLNTVVKGMILEEINHSLTIQDLEDKILEYQQELTRANKLLQGLHRRAEAQEERLRELADRLERDKRELQEEVAND